MPTSLLALALILAGGEPILEWVDQSSHTDARFRGVFAVSEQVAWASGTKGMYARTSDGGKTWVAGRVPGADELDFRDVHAFDAKTAYLLAAGPADASRIYKTTDAGANWTLQLTNPDPKGFLDAIAFFDRDHGLAFGDPIDGRFTLYRADDGQTWNRVDTSKLPPSLPNEGAFAASGTCLITHGPRDAWFATGGAKVSRVFHSSDQGKTWTVAETPVLSANVSSGIFSLAFSDVKHGLAIGGDYKAPDRPGLNLAQTKDGGQTWDVTKEAPRAYRSGLAFVPGRSEVVIAVGPTGSDLSQDGGATWTPLGSTGFHAVSAAGPNAIWAVGDNGQIAKLAGLPSRRP